MEQYETAQAVHSTGAVEIDADEHIYSHPEYTQKLYDHHGFSAQTLYELINQAVQLYGDRPLFSYRSSLDTSFQSYSYKQVWNMILDIGSAMAHLGLNISNEAFIGIYGSATIYYALFLYSSWCYSFVPVGIYDSLGHDGVQFIIKHANLKLIFADNLKRVHNLIECHDESSSLETIVSLSEPSLDLIEIAKAKGIRLVTYTTMMDL
ncbi:unnamed protein product, partial [Rotaria magnacalcarata]